MNTIDGNGTAGAVRYRLPASVSQSTDDIPASMKNERGLVPRRMYPPLNYIQTLGLMGDQRAVPVIRPYYEKYLKAMEAEAVSGVPDDVFFGSVPYPPLLINRRRSLQDYAIRGVRRGRSQVLRPLKRASALVDRACVRRNRADYSKAERGVCENRAAPIVGWSREEAQ